MPRSRRARASAMLLSHALTQIVLARLVLAGDALQKTRHLAVLRRLRVRPVADHLLLVAHMANEAVDRLGEVCHRGGRLTVRAGLRDGFLEALDRGAHLARGRGDRDTLSAEI